MRALRWAGLLPVVLLMACATNGGAPAPESVASEARKVRGHDAYKADCARCHGPNGKGDGPDAGTTRVPTADLTTITLRHGGVFPEAQIVQIIDGRRDIRAHGPSGMPVWGNKFAPNVSGGGPAEVVVKDQVKVLVEYIRSIQVRAPSEGGSSGM